MNYNHDGLATDLLRDIHRVIPVHGTVEAWIGSPEAREFILTAGVDYGLAISTDRLLMLEPESYCDADLERRLSAMVRVKPEFVAIIGYTFARTNCGHDDAVSLDCFVDHYREFRGPVFVVDPAPEPLQELLAQRLRVAHVVGLPVRWNLLAHAFLKALAGRLYGQTLGDHCKALLDAGHEWSAYPLAVDLNGEAPAR